MLVSEIMSTPVVTATADETVAAAAARMREQGVGSVVVVDGERAVGHPHRTRSGPPRGRRASPGGDTVAEWMTADPDCVAPDVDATAAFASLAEHGYRHIPVVDGERLVGIVSMRDVMRVAQIQPAENLAHEVPRGLEGVVVAETSIGDVRGLEGFYHYRQYNAVELAEKRTLEDVWHLMFEGAAAHTGGARRVPSRDRAVARDPGAGEGGAPRRRRRRGSAPPLDLLRTTVSLMGAALGFRPSLDVDAAELAGRRCRCARWYPRCSPRSTGCSRVCEIVDPDPALAYAANYLYMMRGEVP